MTGPVSPGAPWSGSGPEQAPYPPRQYTPSPPGPQSAPRPAASQGRGVTRSWWLPLRRSAPCPARAGPRGRQWARVIGRGLAGGGRPRDSGQTPQGAVRSGDRQATASVAAAPAFQQSGGQTIGRPARPPGRAGVMARRAVSCCCTSRASRDPPPQEGRRTALEPHFDYDLPGSFQLRSYRVGRAHLHGAGRPYR